MSIYNLNRSFYGLGLPCIILFVLEFLVIFNLFLCTLQFYLFVSRHIPQCSQVVLPSFLLTYKTCYDVVPNALSAIFVCIIAHVSDFWPVREWNYFTMQYNLEFIPFIFYHRLRFLILSLWNILWWLFPSFNYVWCFDLFEIPSLI